VLFLFFNDYLAYLSMKAKQRADSLSHLLAWRANKVLPLLMEASLLRLPSRCKDQRSVG
jgi:hypothetical protein